MATGPTRTPRRWSDRRRDCDLRLVTPREDSLRGRLRNARGVAPIPANSGQVTAHYRLNRYGDRQLNRAIHTVVLSRIRWDEETQDYVKRRTAEGKTPREIKRCLKRYVARELFRLLESGPSAT